ncbi:hypothetical protein OJAV_G00106330 [Oryzias javanicus]|uniref:Uncharacterized protein n=1 Tax=Oryzias javanicus TaxID=123683 RepID=A0A437CTS3_ORYJA|nr:hypothetical protein OJAV_G00106330 [Oryzias javanicus]
MKSSFTEWMISLRGMKPSGNESRKPLIDGSSDAGDVTSASSTQPDPDRDHKNLQEEVRQFLTRALQSQPCCCEEDYVRLYVDIIPFIRAKTAAAVVCDGVWAVCYRELQEFVQRFKQQQTEELGNKAKTWRENRKTFETIDFLKTLKTCKELRLHIQTAVGRIPPSLLKDTVAELEDMEVVTMNLLMGVIARMTESHLKDYFRSAQKWLPLLTDLVNYFPKRPYAAEEQKNSLFKLRRWSADVGPAVSMDACRLHQTMENLAPGVQERNGILLRIKELLECEDTDGLKLTMAFMEQECTQHNADLDLLPKLLQWKGLSRQEVKEVMGALRDAEEEGCAWWRDLTCCVSTCRQQQKPNI